MCSLLLLFSLPLKNMFYNILINQRVTKLFQKTCEKMIDIFGVNRYIRYFCTRFPRDGKPWNWHSDRNGYWTPANFSSFALILTKNNAAEKKFEKKNFRNIWKLSDKVLTFAPAFVEKQFKNWLPDRNGAKNVFFFFYLPFDKRDDEKKKKEKNFRKHLEDMLKSSYLCIRFLKRKAV